MRVSARARMRLLALILLSILAMGLGAWLGEASARDRWIDDDLRVSVSADASISRHAA